jgi:uncharacterized lipoprotein NlpE involved in copper resistance
MRSLKVLCIAAAVLALAGCNKQAESATHAGVGFVVEKLFTTDGCTVYRFQDVGYRYFTNCSGSTFGDTGGKHPQPVGVMGGRP